MFYQKETTNNKANVLSYNMKYCLKEKNTNYNKNNIDNQLKFVEPDLI